jgi:squalene-associated FAD-dependent desaturase
MPFESVTVIGGGLAGLSSAVALADAGFRVRLLEKRPYLGGRATSYQLPDGSHVDNCQHVTLGCCTNLADFYRRVGAEEKVRFYNQLYFVDASGRRFAISPSALPPPFHMAPSFLRFGALSFADKRSIARTLLQIARRGGHPPGAHGASMLDWLHRMRQTPGAIERFWRVVLVSALDEELSRIDARYGIDVFWKAFLANRGGFKIGIPVVPLGDLYQGCRAAVERRGGEVHSRAGVREIRLENEKATGIVLDDGSELGCDACIVAVPQDALLGLLPSQLVEREPSLAGLRHLRNAPITGVHLWFDRAVMREPFLTLLDHTVQWIFNKSLLYSPVSRNGQRPEAVQSPSEGGIDAAAGASQYLQLVISASYDLVTRSRQEIIELCRRELRDVLPATREAQLLKATVIKEVAATFSPEPGSDQWRPGSGSPVRNLFLAGDWTRTGWPATMEGAVRSGYLAAEAVLAAAGRPQKVLVPDLPAQGLCRFWSRSSEGVK